MRDEPEALDLRRLLPELKRRGCAILVTGEVNPTVSMRASRRMFGEVMGDRARVLGLTRQAAMRPDAWLPDPIGTERDAVGLVELSPPSRLVTDAPDSEESIESATTSMVAAIDEAAGELDGAADEHEEAAGELDGAADEHEKAAGELDGAVDEHEEAAGGLGGGEKRFGDGRLRVGVYSLSPLEGRYGGAAVEQFVREVGDRVRAHGGMGHFHFPRADDDAIVDRLDEHVDVRVELRQLAAANPTPEQRWHVDGTSSRWVEL